MSDLPILPYAGTSGHSGTDTSRERAEAADAGGTKSLTALRQAQALRFIARARNLVGDEWGQTGVRFVGRSAGVTVKELRAMSGWHHGVASSVLSTLHKVGKIDMLEERRDRCHVYVLPEHVDGRTVLPHKSNKPKADIRETVEDVVEGHVQASEYGRPVDRCQCRAKGENEKDREWPKRWHRWHLTNELVKALEGK